MNRDEAIRLAGHLYLSDRPDHAEAVLIRQLLETPDDPVVLYNLALICEQDGRLDACTAYCERSLKHSPGFHAAADLLARRRLHDGDWSSGFSLFESRFKKERGEIPYLDFPRSAWNGEELKGRSLLIWSEQGLGDTVQFASLLPGLRKQGLRLVLLVHDELVDLFRESDLADAVVARSKVFAGGLEAVTKLLVDEDVAFHLPIMSLGRVLGLDPRRLRAVDSYLRVSPGRARRAEEIVQGSGQSRELRVGLVWSGSIDGVAEIRKIAARRNIPLSALRPILENRGARFFSLQKGEPAIEAVEFPQVVRLPLSDSFADTAAMLLQMDLLITVDTSICHVGAALGVPVWMLNRFGGCWRWGRKSRRFDWYSSLRIFEQARAGDWSPVVLEAARELGHQVGRDRVSDGVRRKDAPGSRQDESRENP